MYQHQHANWPQSRLYSDVLKRIFGRRQKHTLLSTPLGAKLAKPARSDAQIKQDVKDELRSESTVRASAIDVQVKVGVVTLTGPVDGDGEQWLIETAARRIAGVERLSVNFKTVAPEPGVRTDDDIARECEDVLATLIPESDYVIQVMASNGWVTLLGEVAWGYERWIAETKVSGLPGVCGVNSQVKVRPTVIKNDVDAIIEAAMQGQKEGKRHTVECTVDHGRITLTGTIRSWVERRTVLNAVWSFTGVKRVFDRMLLI
jgi:osmotically-inducible protein OsmY